MVRRQIAAGARPGNRGFTLVEMLAVLAILSTLLLMAAPSFRSVIQNNRLLTESHSLRAALNNARSEAVTQQTFVTFCRSEDGATCSGDWSDGYIAFTDHDGDGMVDEAEEPPGDPADEIFLVAQTDTLGVTITYSNGLNRVRYDSMGFVRDFSGTLELCDERGPLHAKGLIISRVGHVVSARDRYTAEPEDPEDPEDINEPDGIPEDHTGAPLDCS